MTSDPSVSKAQPSDSSPASAPTTSGPVLVIEEPTEEEFEGVESFADAGVHADLIGVIEQIGWKTPTPIQRRALPLTLKQRDLAGFAQTGTGKTAVFLLTIAQFLLKRRDQEQAAGSPPARQPAAVILGPTRELAMQIQADGVPILERLGFRTLAVFGGTDYDKQLNELRRGVDVVMATPGRLKDFVEKRVVDLSQCQVFVCDEVDRMFDMGFIEDVEFFLDRLPDSAHKLIFSATTNSNVKELAFEYLNNPVYVSVNPEVLTPENIEQFAIHVEAKHKLQVLMGLLREHQPECAIIFTNTKIVAEWLHFKLQGNGFEVDLITGDLPQNKRIQLIHKIKQGQIKALVATDVASRGLHISRVSHVYNFDLPDEAANYIHRIGRTARAGARGKAYALVCEDYGHNLSDINKLLGAELALRSTWYSPEYLKIRDEAGTPAPRKRQDRDDRGSSSRRAGGASRSAAGAATERGGPSRRRPHHDTKKDSAPQQRGREKQRRPQHEGRDRDQRQFRLTPGDVGSQRSRPAPVDRSQATGSGQQHLHHRVATPVENAGLIGLARRIWKTIWGKKSPETRP